jgi:predicted RNase H-like nuclease (RuvC/YqgF family)
LWTRTADEQQLLAKIERLRAEKDHLADLCRQYREEIVRLRAELQWIADNDQTERVNGGDPDWFAERAPIRARKALEG